MKLPFRKRVWRCHFTKTVRGIDHGYFKHVEARTAKGAKRMAEIYRHQGWSVKAREVDN